MMRSLTKGEKVGAGFGILAIIIGIVLATRAKIKPPPPPPVVCTPGETKCVGFNLYQCSARSQWELVEANSTTCGWTPTVNYVAPNPNWQVPVFDCHNIFNWWVERQSARARCPWCGAIVTIRCYYDEDPYTTGREWKAHVYGHYAYSKGWNWVDSYAPPGITYEQYMSTRSYHAYLQTELVCALSRERLNYMNHKAGADITLLEVRDVGFNGDVAWYTVKEEHNKEGAERYWLLELAAIPEGQYAAFLAYANSVERVFNPWVRETMPKCWRGAGSWPIGKDWTVEPSDVISHKGPLCLNPLLKLNPLTSGNYVLVLAGHHTSWWEETGWTLQFYKGWELGRIKF